MTGRAPLCIDPFGMQNYGLTLQYALHGDGWCSGYPLVHLQKAFERGNRNTVVDLPINIFKNCDVPLLC